MNTVESRYLINNDPEGDVDSVPTKAEAFRRARRWAAEDRLTYYVYDRMARRGARRLWAFTCTCRPVVEIAGHVYCGGIDDCPVHGFGEPR